MEIIDLKKYHLEEACELFAISYRFQRSIVPILDEKNGDRERIMHMLECCLEKHPGVAVFEHGKMTGYMTGFYIDGLLGVYKGAYSPEWAHASTKEKAFEIYRLMYKAMGQKWVEGRCLTHAINFMFHASKAQEAFCWNGFGDVCFDAVRPVETLNIELPGDVHIDAIQEKDIPALLLLVDGHYRHLAASPVFRPYTEPESFEELEGILRQPGNLAWMAWKGNEAIGYMKVAPVEDGAAWMVNGEKKIAVNGAYVKPEYRGKGISKLLLSTIMEWAIREGFVRCSVDFEVANLEACQFWLKYFQPVCRSMVRRLDERILKSI